MGGFIILEDGRALAPANWAYDAIIRSIAEELARAPDGDALAKWLLDQRCEVLGPGLGSVDVRELSPNSRRMFREACSRAVEKEALRGPKDWHDPSFFPAWLEMFQRLPKMWTSIDSAEPPDALNDLKRPIDPTGENRGPGWEPA